MKILVIGDLIIDKYIMGKAFRLCPEAPVPVVVPSQVSYETRGGAGLVADQIKELLGPDIVIELFGSKSRKERTFVDGRLVLRVDYDGLSEPVDYDGLSDLEHIGAFYSDSVLRLMQKEEISLLVVSDYDKGALDRRAASDIMRAAERRQIPVLVDAKKNWEWYVGAYAMFPNQNEILPLAEVTRHIVRKLGAGGCDVDNVLVPGYEHEVRDVTGAGDIFLAAFAAKLYMSDDIQLAEVADFANTVAGISVTYVGTHVVTGEEIEEFYGESE